VGWAFTLGFRGMVGLWTRFFVTVYDLAKTQRAYRNGARAAS